MTEADATSVVGPGRATVIQTVDVVASPQVVDARRHTLMYYTGAPC